MSKVVISVICYDNNEEIVTFARMLKNQTIAESLLLLVTCNKCANIEGLKRQLKGIGINFEMFNPKQNIGYLKGCLYPFTQKDYEYEWCLISNTDVKFGMYGFFEVFCNKQLAEDIWSVAPNIVEKHGKRFIRRNPFVKNRPTLQRMKIWCFAYQTQISFVAYNCLSKIKRIFVKELVETTSSGKIYAAHGSSFFLHKECVRRLLSEKINIFMYGEELYIAGLIAENGKSEYFFEDLPVIHFPNQTTRLIGSAKKQKWYKESIEYIIKRFWMKG